MSNLEDLAARIKDIEDRVGSRNATQLDSSTIDVGENDESIVLGDVVVGANESIVFTIPGLQEALDLNETRLQEASEAVQAAMDAADAAEEAGLAAGEEASQAADEALVKAQEALDAAAAAGGGAVYTNRAPTAADPGKPGAQWFVWDSNYHVTGYYVYTDDTVKWVATVLDDGTFGNLSAARLTSGFIDAARIAAGSLTAAVLAADTITSREIAADAILARNIKALEITGAKIAAATITGGNIAANTIVAGNIKAGTLTANEIAANTITANEINLDTLNGKTINGLTVVGGTIKTATTGQRLELLQTRMDVYNASNALAGRIFGGQNYGIVTGASLVLQAINGSASGQFLVAAPLNVTCSISPAPYVRAGFTYTGTSLTSTISAVAEGMVVKGPLLADEIWDAVTNQRIIGAVRQTGSAGTRSVIAGTFDRLHYGYSNNGVRTEVPVMTGDPDGNTPNVYITATDFRAPDGTSFQLGDTGWITPTLSSGTNVSGSPFRYRRFNGVVYFDGLVTPSAANTRMFILPVGFRPGRQRRAWIDRNGTASPAQWIVSVLAGGAIDLIGPSGTGSGALDFGGYPPFIADN